MMMMLRFLWRHFKFTQLLICESFFLVDNIKYDEEVEITLALMKIQNLG